MAGSAVAALPEQVSAAQTGTAPLSGIEIYTTKYNESHVYADDLYSLGYGNGYVQARDRLFEMDVLRHVGYGNSAEVLGPSQIPSDVQVKRDLYSRDEIERQWEEASTSLRTVVQGFADGVNRRIQKMAATGRLPGEFTALGHAPEPWKPEDTVACIDYLIGYFGVSGGNELSNAKTLATMVENMDSERDAFDAYEDLNWLRTRASHFTSIPEEDLVVEGGETVPSYDSVPDDQLSVLGAARGATIWGIEADRTFPDDLTDGVRTGFGVMEGFEWGSNALIVDGDLTETGKPMLGGGPQMGFFKPPIPYEIGLHGAGFDVSGIGVVGAPGVVIGRTKDLAWTVTSGEDDMVDTIAVELDPNDRHRYKWDGEWFTMDTHTVEHAASPVPGTESGDPSTEVVEQEVARIEQDGAVMPVVAWNESENIAWCQRTTTRYDELAGAFSWVKLGRASSLDDVEEALAEFPFTFNFNVVSDEDIEYIHTGKVPTRDDVQDHRLPQRSKYHAWTEITTGLGLGTYVRNPSRGYVVNWNNGPVTGWRAGDTEQQWGSVHRVEELNYWVRDHLGVPETVGDGSTVKEHASNRLAVDDVKTLVMQAALHDATAYASVPFMADVASQSDDRTIREMGAQLREWLDAFCSWYDDDASGDVPHTDGPDDRYDHPGMAIYEAVRRELQTRTFEDELGDHVPPLNFVPAVSRHAQGHGSAWADVTFIDALNAGPGGPRTPRMFGRRERAMNHDWFDDVHTQTDESRDAVIENALEAAKETLAGRFGSDRPTPDQWQEPTHKSKFRSLGASNRSTMDMRNRSSYNQAIDMSRADSDVHAVWTAAAGDVMPPSNSGLITDAELAKLEATGTEPARLHDQLQLYIDNTYKPHPVTRTQVEQVADSHQTVHPSSE